MARPKGRTMLNLKCEHCGTNFVRRKGQESARAFCSRRCYWDSDYRRGIIANANVARNPAAWYEAPCEACGTNVRRHASRRPKQTFCSRACHNHGSRRPQLKGGYVLIHVGKGEPGATKSGHVFEHRKVMQDALGRPLLPEENVHHKNGIRDDNRLENLELWSRSQPNGQRVEDKVQWAREFLSLYGKEF